MYFFCACTSCQSITKSHAWSDLVVEKRKGFLRNNILIFIGMFIFQSSSLHNVNTSSLSGSPFRSFPDKSWPKMNPQSDPGPSTSHPTSSPVPFLSSTLYDEMECEDQQSFEETSPGTLPLVTEDGISEEFRSSLADRGKISGFTITYHDLLEKGYSGNYMCFVRLDTKPPAVCNGVGPTKTYAHEKAAQNALQYLNTVCS